MALNDLKLSMMAFPQYWDSQTRTLNVNLLLLPVGDPMANLVGSDPQFAGTTVSLNANILDGLDTLPTTSTPVAQVTPVLAQPPGVATALFTQLVTQLNKKGVHIVPQLDVGQAPKATARIKKALPPSYTQAFPFEAPRSSDITIFSRYGCAVRNQAPPLNAKPIPPDKNIAWGQIISYALHQPLLAQAMGLIYNVNLPILQSNLLANGGFVYFTLDTSSKNNNPWPTLTPAMAKSYAARLPALASPGSRQLFAAKLMPVMEHAPANLAEAQFEAAEFDDGFAQIVHSNQPTTIDAVSLDTDQIPPGTDAGIQIGWDDEQVTMWFNNQVDLLRYRLDQTGFLTPPAESPLGVSGYRVDVRIKGTSQWYSLCKVSGTLPFTMNSNVAPATTPIDGNELWVAPAPVRPSWSDNITNDQPALLPLYFAKWAGSSLVLPDPVVKLLAKAVSHKDHSVPLHLLPLPPSNPYPDLTSLPGLRYGQEFEFRVRLVDLTGGGPTENDIVIHPGPAPVTTVTFQRYVPPKSLEVTASPPIAPYPKKPPAVRTIHTLEVRRPRIGYPEALFTGVDPATFYPAHLIKLLEIAWAKNRAFSVPDPDVDSFNVIVEARVPAHDTGIASSEPSGQDGVFRVIYKVNVSFPTTNETDPTVTINLDYVDHIDEISSLIAPAVPTTNLPIQLPIPTARDIRIRLCPVCGTKPTQPDYYGTSPPPVGPYSDYIVRREASTEDALFPDDPGSQLQAFYFQPNANLPQLLAQQLGLEQQSLTFSGAPGVRTVFGASGSLRHTISGDASSITFSNQTEMQGHWIVALMLDLNRDWTWDGLVPKKSQAGNKPQITIDCDSAPIGVVTIPRVIAPTALGNPGQTPDRSRTRIIYFDALDPNPAPGDYPSELCPVYTVTANFAKAAPQKMSLPITLPITTPPALTPKIVSTGIAESPYTRSADYSQTMQRDRYLWIEFDQAPADPEDTYFARVLAYGPDPLLAAALLPSLMKPDVSEMLPEAIEPPLPINPEPVRVIFSGQSADDAGMDAMTQMVPASLTGIGKDGTFFLLPLPPGLTSENLELFGFWTYEFRVGHEYQIGNAIRWSTAQGRFGRPLRVTGIQHPVPQLICTVTRNAEGIAATAPYANTVYNGRRVYDLLEGDPQTRIWFMLYAQVLQADGATCRNVLLTRRLGVTIPTPPDKTNHKASQSINRDPRAGVLFTKAEGIELLAGLGLPTNTPLSVLAVEVLPGPLSVPVTDSPAAPKDDTRDAAQPAPETRVNDPAEDDPLGTNLGRRRILRVSLLVAVKSVC
jgi:hypothetical protein